jgi:hypothetical protein
VVGRRSKHLPLRVHQDSWPPAVETDGIGCLTVHFDLVDGGVTSVFGCAVAAVGVDAAELKLGDEGFS